MVMDSSKDIRSDEVEPGRSEADEGSFFKKYTLVSPQEGELIDGHVFKKYVPIRESIKAPVKQRSWPGTTLLLWASVVVAALLLTGWIVFYELLRREQPQANQTPSTQTSTD